MKLRKIIAGLLAVVMVLTAVPLDNMAVVKAEETRTKVTGSDSDWATYLLLNSYQRQDNSKFGGPSFTNIKADYPSLYEDMTGIYSAYNSGKANRWPYIAFKVNVEEAGTYTISARATNYNKGKTIGMLVDGAMYMINHNVEYISQQVYLSAGDHVVIFTTPMPRDMETRPSATGTGTDYQWTNYFYFQVSDGATFVDKPTSTEIQNAMTSYARLEAEDATCAAYNGNYGADISKTYKVKYNRNGATDSTEAYTVSGSTGSTIDKSVTDAEKTVNSTQTYQEIERGGLDKTKTSYVEYKVKAEKAGTYMIRVGAYVEGSGTMPYGTVLVNDKAYKVQFAGNWNGWDAVNLPVELKAGWNTIRCIGVTEDQTGTEGWIGYDYLDIQSGLLAERTKVTAADNEWDDYLLTNKYTHDAAKDVFYVTNSGDIKWDYPTLYEEMLGIYSSIKTDRANKWPYIAFTVNAEKAGKYQISAEVKQNGCAVNTLGMIVDGALYVLEVESDMVTKEVELSQGNHTIIFTPPMPRDAKEKEGTEYSTYNSNDNKAIYETSARYESISLSTGLIFDTKPTNTEIQTSMTNFTRIEAEDEVCVTHVGNYDTDLTTTYTTQYNNAETTIVGAEGAAIDGSVADGEKSVNTTQTYNEVATSLDKTKTAYLQYKVLAEAAGTYIIRVGAYVEGSGTMPYGTILVNGKAYKAEFSGNWNGYDAVNLAVELAAGENTIQCIGVTADQTDAYANSWIGYDFLDVPSGVKAISRESSAADEDWNKYLLLNLFEDAGNLFNVGKNAKGDSAYNDIRWDYPSLYEEMFGIYYSTKEARANWWPYIAFTVNAEEAGEYIISAKANINKDVEGNKTFGMIIDGAMHVMEVKEGEEGTASAPTTISKSVYLTKGEHVVIFTIPMPRDAKDAEGCASSGTAYPWINYHGFILGEGLEFGTKPTNADVQSAMTSYTKMEAEDTTYASYNGNYNKTMSKTYETRYNNAQTSVVGAKGGAIDDSVTAKEKTVNTTQTFDELAAGLDKDFTSYIQYKVSVETAGTYMIRVGAYVEGSGTMPYGTVLVNGNVYKAQFAGNWNGYDAVNLPVELTAGENVIQCVGVTADQIDADGWIGYDYLEVANGVYTETTEYVSASEENWNDHLLLNLFEDAGSLFNVGKNAKGDSAYNDIRWDYPSLYEEMFGIYDSTKEARANWWPYIAFTVNAEEAGYYTISAKVNINAIEGNNTFGMVVDGAMYVMEMKDGEEGTSKTPTILSKRVYLSKGEHIVIFTIPMPRDAKDAEGCASSGTAYPWINYHGFILGEGLEFGAKPTTATVQKAMTSYTRLESEDVAYAAYNKAYDSDVTKKFESRYNNTTTTVVGVNGGAIDGNVTAEEKAVNSAQTYTEIAAKLDSAKTPYVEYKVTAKTAGTYVIRVGAYIEGSGAMPYGTVLVNGKAYKTEFTGNLNGHDAVNLAVELKKGTNTIQLIGVTADQTAVNGWIGYDYLDMQSGLTAEKTQLTVLNAGDEKYVLGHNYEDQGDILGGARYWDLRADRVTMENLAYADISRMPFAGVKVEAAADGYYDIYFTATSNSQGVSTQVGLLVDGTDVYTLELVQPKMRATIYLTAGTHTLLFTTPIPADEATALAAEFNDAMVYPWMNMYSIILDAGLTVKAAPTLTEMESAFVAINANEYAMPNMTEIKEDMVGGAKYTYAQKLSEIQKNGIDEAQTPFVEYTINASEAGEYTIYLGMKVGLTAAATADRVTGNIVIENNGKLQVKTVLAVKGVTASKNVPVTLTLKKGINKVRVTHFTADSLSGEGVGWNDFYDIKMREEVAKKLIFLPTSGVVEAENSEYINYTSAYNDDYSGGAYIGSAAYSFVDSYDITFENLDVNNLDDVSRVTYTVIAKQAGTYSLSLGFSTGTTNYTTQELKELGKVGIAMIVNGGEKQLIEYELKAMKASMTRLVTVDLVEGENEITFTCTLAEYINYVAADSPDKRVVWIDHDYLRLSYGVSGSEEDQRYSVEDSDIDHARLTLKSVSSKPDKIEQNIDDTKDINVVGMAIMGIGILLLLALVIFIIILMKKRKEKDELENS